jgi:transcriptional regulator of nitric oxide reductase
VFSVTRRFAVARPWRRALLAFTRSERLELGRVSTFEPACVVADDPGEVVRSAKPTSAHDRERMREQQISRMMAEYRRQHSEPVAVASAVN